MKTKTSIAIALIIGLLLGVFAYEAFFTTVGASDLEVTKSDSNERTVSTIGEATITADPDIAYISLGVRTENKDSKVAQDENAKATNNVINVITKEFGIKKEDIKTINFSINPNYNYNPVTGKSSIDGYVVNNIMNVTIRDIAKVGEVIKGVSDNGSNVINNISFDISNKEELYNEALKEAVKNSEKKAKIMLEPFAINKVYPKTVIEQSSMSYSTANSGGRYMMDSMAVMEKSSIPSISTGEIDIKATVNVVFNY